MPDLGGRNVTVLVDDISDGGGLGLHFLLLFSSLLGHLDKVLVQGDLLLQEIIGIFLGLLLLRDLLLNSVNFLSNPFGIELHFGQVKEGYRKTPSRYMTADRAHEKSKSCTARERRQRALRLHYAFVETLEQFRGYHPCLLAL
jgi:hypothetical protein